MQVQEVTISVFRMAQGHAPGTHFRFSQNHLIAHEIWLLRTNEHIALVLVPSMLARHTVTHGIYLNKQGFKCGE